MPEPICPRPMNPILMACRSLLLRGPRCAACILERWHAQRVLQGWCADATARDRGAWPGGQNGARLRGQAGDKGGHAMGKLDRRIAVVTGAATGLGKAIALLYAAEGADVAIIDRNTEGAATTAAAITKQGRRSLAIGADVGDEAAVEKAFARILAELGDPRILVNNAGIATVSLLE